MVTLHAVAVWRFRNDHTNIKQVYVYTVVPSMCTMRNDPTVWSSKVGKDRQSTYFCCCFLSHTHFSHAQHQPTVTALHVRWLEFFRDYQSFLQWLKTMDLDMSNLNPFVKDMDAVKTQLEKLKVSLLQLHADTLFSCSTVNQDRFSSLGVARST